MDGGSSPRLATAPFGSSPAAGADDALLAAVISKLPPIGSGFTADGRTKWLRMMAMAFDVAYGETGVVEIPNFLSAAADAQTGSDQANAGGADSAAASPPARPKPAPHAAAGFDFYIDSDGFARCDYERVNGTQVPSPKRQVNADEISDDEAIYDYRSPRNKETIIWADNTMGARPGMTFGGPG